MSSAVLISPAYRVLRCECWEICDALTHMKSREVSGLNRDARDESTVGRHQCANSRSAPHAGDRDALDSRLDDTEVASGPSHARVSVRPVRDHPAPARARSCQAVVRPHPRSRLWPLWSTMGTKGRSRGRADRLWSACDLVELNPRTTRVSDRRFKGSQMAILVRTRTPIEDLGSPRS